MAFCINCGAKLQDGAKFCATCGTPIGSTEERTRKTIYEGDVHKCPQCGEVINSFVSVCPTCGHEFRGIAASKSIKEFFEKIETASTDDLRISLIRNYPIPNSKEDITEFMILASSNICGDIEKSLFEAWKAKFDQGYQKAKKVFDEDEFAEIQKLYEKTQIKTGKAQITQTTKQAKGVFSKFWAIMPNRTFGIVAILLICLLIVHLLSGSFEVGHITISALILVVVYKITTKKPKKQQAKNTEKGSTPEVTEVPRVQKIKVPDAVISGKFNEDYTVVEAVLSQAGFQNVKSVPLRDLSLGIFHQPNSVDSITVNGKDLSHYFRQKFDSNAFIVISYHSYK